MSTSALLKNIKSLKQNLFNAIKDQSLKPLSEEDNPFHNPIAKAIKDKNIHFSVQEQTIINNLKKSAKLVITKENQRILHDYFVQRRLVNDNLGNLYKTLTFSDFILRLFNKRFTEVYYDGRAVVLRNGKSYGASSGGKSFLQNIGTNEDNQDFYTQYLTLEEAVLSPLVLPQATSIIIGTGNRSTEDKWNVAQEFNESIDVATISYPAAAEFRNGKTAHYDFMFIVKPLNKDAFYLKQLESIESNSALLTAARKIYGQKFAFEIEDFKDERLEKITENNQTYYLNKDAYIARTTSMLKSLLLAADAQMHEDKLGTTFQLKGLGLGAFSFSTEQNSAIIERLYVNCVKSVLQDKSFKLKHIKCVNLINLPTDLKSKQKNVKHVICQSKVKLIRSCMAPSSNLNVKKIGDIGAVVVCGDSGSKFGNEGNIGLCRNSSDDPAAQYSLFDPLILDFEENPILRERGCIKLVENGSFQNLQEPPYKIHPLAPKIKKSFSFTQRQKAMGMLGITLGTLCIAPIFNIVIVTAIIAITSTFLLGFAAIKHKNNNTQNSNVLEEIPKVDTIPKSFLESSKILQFNADKKIIKDAKHSNKSEFSENPKKFRHK